MAWRLDGTYFESCSCDEVCPCTWSAFTAKATLDRCRALLAYHVDSGEIDGVDVSGLNFAIFLDTPPVMGEGNWRVGSTWTTPRRTVKPSSSGQSCPGSSAGHLRCLPR